MLKWRMSLNFKKKRLIVINGNKKEFAESSPQSFQQMCVSELMKIWLLWLKWTGSM